MHAPLFGCNPWVAILNAGLTDFQGDPSQTNPSQRNVRSEMMNCLKSTCPLPLSLKEDLEIKHANMVRVFDTN